MTDKTDMSLRDAAQAVADLRNALAKDAGRASLSANAGEPLVRYCPGCGSVGPVALGQPVGNGSDQVAGHPSAQGDKLLTVAERNIRSFLRSATLKSESDREAALNCVDVLWEAARAPAGSVPAPVLDSLALMKVVMQADEALSGRCTRGTTNWAAAIGKAVQDAVLAARAPADSVLEDAARLLRQILAASQDGDSDTHLSAHFVSRIETITKAGGAA